MAASETTPIENAAAPVTAIDTEPEHVGGPQPGMALCLSGGGYRAMLFHLGALWRLNEAGLLGKLDRVSSVSGGSITAGVLAMNWSRLAFDRAGVATQFGAQVVDPVRAMPGKTIDAGSVIEGILLPGSINDKIVGAYRKYLFGHKTLQDLPDTPRFVINATNVQSGALWRFEKLYMRDYRVGEVRNPTVELAVAVAASSAFPPVLSPAELELEHESFTPGSGTDLQRPPFTTDVVLTDGGVYDNLGLETAWKRYQTILVSDGGGKEGEEAEPARDWARHSIRILGLIDNQVRSLRKRQLIDSYVNHTRAGAYWGIRTDIRNYGLADALPCPLERTMSLALVATRLQRLEPEIQERLINWGYAVCDAALRRHCPEIIEHQQPPGFPYPAVSV
jgi:predicted acylesterase/phospholipase RssA